MLSGFSSTGDSLSDRMGTYCVPLDSSYTNLSSGSSRTKRE